MSLVYNPNPDIAPYHSMDMNPLPLIDFPTDGNFKPSSISYQPSLPQIDPRSDPRSDPRIDYNPMPPANINPPMPPVYSPPRKPHYSKVEEISNVDTKINWPSIFKKIIVYAILFLLMNTMKLNNIICTFIPYLEQNELLCMSLKGIVFGIIIVLLQIFI